MGTECLNSLTQLHEKPKKCERGREGERELLKMLCAHEKGEREREREREERERARPTFDSEHR